MTPRPRRSRKIRWIALTLISLLLLAGFSLLRMYRLDLIHTVVRNAVIQKAPSEADPRVIRAAFERAREAAVQSRQQEVYLERLFQISQRLEKVQALTAPEVRELLERLHKPSIRSE